MTGDPSDIREAHLRRQDFLGAFGVLQGPDGVLMVQNRRRIGGEDVLVWDLPGGQVEPGETLLEALARELAEETGLIVEPPPPPELLFLQEGVRESGGVRQYVWRSFFFRVARWHGVLACGSEVLATRWVGDDEIETLLTAPYHDSYRAWRRGGGALHASRWSD